MGVVDVLRQLFGGDTTLASLKEHEERVRLLEQRYSGPFAKAMKADFEVARAYLAGCPYTKSS